MSGQMYEVTQDIQNQTIDTCLDITASNIVLDGNGNRVNGMNETQFSTGIRVSANNVTVKNFGNVTGWDDGVVSEESLDTVLTNNVANNNAGSGIRLLTIGAVVTGNTANGNGEYGIWLAGDSDNEIVGNVVEDNIGAGVYLGGLGGGANDNVVEDNTARRNEYGFWLRNSFGNEFSENLAENNLLGIYTEESLSNTFTDDTSKNNIEFDFVDTRSIRRERELETTQTVSDLNTVENLNIGNSEKPDTEVSFKILNFVLRGTSVEPPENPDAEATGRYFETSPAFFAGESIEGVSVEPQELPDALLDIDLHYENADLAGIDESSLRLWAYGGGTDGWEEIVDVSGIEDSEVDQGNNVVSWNVTLSSIEGVSTQSEGGLSTAQEPEIPIFGAFGDRADCVDRRNLGRGLEDQECPFDRSIERGGSREDVDRKTGRSGRGEHRDSETARRNRGRGEGRSR